MFIVFLLLGVLGLSRQTPSPGKSRWKKCLGHRSAGDLLGNLWEKDWLVHHKNRGDKYPRSKEVTLIKDYFRRKGAPLLDIRVKPYMKGEPLCQTCGCDRGDTLFLLVRGNTRPNSWGWATRSAFPPIAYPKPFLP